MKKDVLIKIKDRQTINGDSETLEIMTKGELEGDAMNYSLKFTEHFDEDYECQTFLEVKNGSLVTMTRSGGYSSEMIFEHNKRHNCHYITPYGDVLVGIFAKDIHSTHSSNGGSLRLHYTVDFYSGLAAENKMTIRFKPFSN